MYRLVMTFTLRISLLLAIIVTVFTVSAAAQTPPTGVTRGQLRCRQLTDNSLCELDLPPGGSYQNPAWSPDSRALLLTHFAAGYNVGTPTLLVVDLVTHQIRRIGTGVNLPGNSNTWSRSQRIVYAHEPSGSENVVRDAQGAFIVAGEQAYVSRVGANAPPSPITNHRDEAWEPALAPEGVFPGANWVVFQDRHDRRILITRVSPSFVVGRRQAHLDITDRRLVAAKQPVWSPDGRHIVYQGKTGTGDWRLQLVRVPADPAQLARVGSFFTEPLPVPGTDPSFSPDGGHIVYSGGDGAHDTLWATKLPKTGTPTRGVRVTRRPSGWYEGAPGWSPNGRFIAYESSHGPPDGARTTIWIAPAPRLP